MRSKNYILSLTSSCLTFLLISPALLAAPISDQTLPNLQYRADSMLKLGNRELQTGQLIAALTSLQESLTIYQEIGDRSGEAEVMVKLGETHFTLGDYQQAIDDYSQSLQLMEILGNESGIADILDRLSNAYLNLGQQKLAQSLKEQATILRREIGNPEREAAFLSNLGLDSQKNADYKQAIAFHSQQLDISQRINNPKLQVYSLDNLGKVQEKLGQFSSAIALYQQELDLAQKLGDSYLVNRALEQLGLTYYKQGDFQQAIAFYQQQLELAQKSDNTVNTAYLTKQLGLAYISSGKPELAIALYQDQVTKAKAIKDTFTQGIATNNLAFALFKAGKFNDAQSVLGANIKIWQSLRIKLDNPHNYTEEQANTYSLLQQILIAQNQPEAALEIAEQGSTEVFLKLLGMRLATESIGTGLPIAPAQIVPLNIEQIKKIAQVEKATLVKYEIIPDDQHDRLYIWVIQPSGKVTFRQISPKSQNTIFPITTISEVIDSIPTALGIKGKPENENQPLLQLHQILIKPIADLLPNNPSERVVFIPENKLLIVPFSALVDVEGKYLIEKHTITTIPAISLLKFSREQGKHVGGHRVIVVGNPTMPIIAKTLGEAPQPLLPLVNAEQEALEVASLFKTPALIGNQPTKAILIPLLPKARIIHLATYGLLDDVKRQGIAGSIALAKAGSDSGLLSATEIIGLYAQPKGKRLRAGLVVLSAGETGKGTNTGIGVVGLSLALISAGVPSIIISDWSIPDAPTNSLMTEFYRLLKQNPDKAQALRTAILTIMKQYPHPRYWAGFNLIGQAK